MGMRVSECMRVHAVGSRGRRTVLYKISGALQAHRNLSVLRQGGGEERRPRLASEEHGRSLEPPRRG